VNHNIDRTQIGFGGQMGGYPPSASGKVFNEEQEAEYALELLGANNEYELENFFGDLISKAGSAIGRFVSSPTGQALGGMLKSAAKQILPQAAQALGGAIGGQGGAQIGGQLGSALSGLFGEGEVGEQEYEAAKTVVNLAADAVKNAATAPPNANPIQVAKAALAEAAKIHAPGLVLGDEAPSLGREGKKHGRWMRHGNKIVLFGV
jgi:hypothetical protein